MTVTCKRDPKTRSTENDSGNRFLLHATHSGKAKAIQMKGFRIGPKTKKGTAYTQDIDLDTKRRSPTRFSIERDEAFKCSEDMLEKVRKEKYSNQPTRVNSIFFFPMEGNSWADEPTIYKTEELDEMGREEYDFGYGKDTMFVVDRTKVPGKCGVGDNAQSDSVFKICLDGGPEEDQRKEAEKFWKRAEIYNYNQYDPFKQDKKEEPFHDLPEVWCPCTIPKEAIVEKFDKNNPPPDDGISQEDLGFIN